MTNNSIVLFDKSVNLINVRLDTAQYPRVKSIPVEVATKDIQRMVCGACILRGQQMDDDQMALTAAALLEEIRSSYPSITMVEVGKAIKEGVFEQYGPVFGINAVSLFKMVKAYAESDEQIKLSEDVAKRKAGREQDAREANRRFLEAHPEYVKSTLNTL